MHLHSIGVILNGILVNDLSLHFKFIAILNNLRKKRCSSIIANTITSTIIALMAININL